MPLAHTFRHHHHKTWSNRRLTRQWKIVKVASAIRVCTVQAARWSNELGLSPKLLTLSPFLFSPPYFLFFLVPSLGFLFFFSYFNAMWSSCSLNFEEQIITQPKTWKEIAQKHAWPRNLMEASLLQSLIINNPVWERTSDQKHIAKFIRGLRI